MALHPPASPSAAPYSHPRTALPNNTCAISAPRVCGTAALPPAIPVRPAEISLLQRAAEEGMR